MVEENRRFSDGVFSTANRYFSALVTGVASLIGGLTNPYGATLLLGAALERTIKAYRHIRNYFDYRNNENVGDEVADAYGYAGTASSLQAMLYLLAPGASAVGNLVLGTVDYINNERTFSLGYETRMEFEEQQRLAALQEGQQEGNQKEPQTDE